jgi:ferredoxin
MVNIIFRSGSAERIVQANIGETLLAVAQRNGVRLYGGCRGAGVCGTCHVYIGSEFLDKAGEASADEEDLLDSLPNVESNSRLACQVVVTEEMNEMVVTIP